MFIASTGDCGKGKWWGKEEVLDTGFRRYGFVEIATVSALGVLTANLSMTGGSYQWWVDTHPTTTPSFL